MLAGEGEVYVWYTPAYAPPPRKISIPFPRGENAVLVYIDLLLPDVRCNSASPKIDSVGETWTRIDNLEAVCEGRFPTAAVFSSLLAKFMTIEIIE